MPLYVLKTDITKIEADAIVNIRVNPDFKSVVGNIIDMAIVENAGMLKLGEVREKAVMLEANEFILTEAPGLKALNIMHIKYEDWMHKRKFIEVPLIGQLIRITFAAKNNNLKSIAVPLIIYDKIGYSKSLAIEIANRVCKAFLKRFELTIYLVVYEYEHYCLSEVICNDINAYIDKNYIKPPDNVFYQTAPDVDGYYRNLNYLIENVDVNFATALLRHIDSKGLSDSEVYRRANIDKRLFNKIKKPKYHPSKKTALALALALELNLDELKDLIGKAGYSLTRSDKRDIIVEYCVTNKEFDILKINTILYAYGEQLFE